MKRSLSSPWAKPVLGDEGVNYIAEALQVNETLKSLRFASCEHSREQMKLICLYTCSLAQNGIGPDGARGLADSLKVNISLIHLE